MSATIEVKYFNSFWLKKIVDNADDKANWPGLPWNPTFTPTNATTSVTYPTFPAFTPKGNNATGFYGNFYVEEASYKGGFNNSRGTLGVRAYTVIENKDKVDRTYSLIYSGLLNTRTGFNQTNVFSISDPLVKDLDPINGSIQRLYTENTNLNIFQENKVSYTLISKNAIYSGTQGSAEGGSIQFLGQNIPYAGEYGISTNPESFAIFGYRKYFADKTRGLVLRLSGDGITEISNYGMLDFFRDNLSTLSSEWQTTTDELNISTFTASSTTVNSVNVSKASCRQPLGSDIVIAYNLGSGILYHNAIITNSSATTTAISFEPPILNTVIGAVYSGWTAISSSQYKNKIQGGWDIHNKVYTISIQTLPQYYTSDKSTYSTLTYEERVPMGGAWTSFFTFKPLQMGSLKNNFYSFINSSVYKHYYQDIPNGDTNRGEFYGVKEPANITFIINKQPTIVKNFNTIGYEGSNGWEATQVYSDWEGFDPDGPYPSSSPLQFLDDNQFRDQALPVKSYLEGQYQDQGITFYAGFDRKENHYVANFVNNSVERPQEILYGADMSGIKGYFTTITFQTDATTQPGGEKELFSVSSNYVLSSY